MCVTPTETSKYTLVCVYTDRYLIIHSCTVECTNKEFIMLRKALVVSSSKKKRDETKMCTVCADNDEKKNIYFVDIICMCNKT